MSYSIIDKLYANRPFEADAEVFGRKFTFRALSGKDEEEISRFARGENMFSYIESRKLPTLARAIIAIDSIRVSEFDEIKQRLRSPGVTLAQAMEEELSGKDYNSEMITEMYLSYMEVKTKFRNQLDELKKNSSPQNPA